MNGAVSISQLSKVFSGEAGRTGFSAVKDLSLDIRDGEFMVLVGPSGCGKSTTLRLLAGLETATNGTITIGGKDVTHLEPKERGVAMVFQSYALYPHMTVFDNMAFALRLAGKPPEQIRETVLRTAALLGLDEMLNRKPQALSGGQRQRVALGRAIVREPAVFLFDEPLSNLDARMRVQMRAEIMRLHARLGTTMIYVTHDQVEAMTMGDRLCVLRDGVIMQVGEPLALYREPANLFVAGFLGSPPMNLIRGRLEKRDSGWRFSACVEAGGWSIPLQGRLERLAQKLSAAAPAQAVIEVVLGIRPEHVGNDAGAKSHAQLTLIVDFAEQMGAESIVHLKSGNQTLAARKMGEHFYKPGEPFTANLELERAHFFEPVSERIITEKD